jgi:O-antigen/teichoic acid export membrane protein
MSRLKNFSRNLATSYLQLAVNAIYSLASVPLILHWLPRAQFGLWSTMVQMISYITLVDLGINSAVARFLVDHKDARGDGKYAALVRTSLLVSLLQGLIILTVVTLGSPWLAALMKVPSEFQATFVNLMRFQGLIVAFTFCTNPLGIMLNAHQRTDLISRQSMFNLAVGLGLLWLFLLHGSGIYSFIYANAITAVIAPCQLFWHCRRLGFLPAAGEEDRMTWSQFKEVFFYGKDVFLMGLGAQLITTSQIIIISRTLGLDAAATWSVGTKIFMLVRMIMFQPFSMATSGLCEMEARKEIGRLRTRFHDLVVLSTSLGVYFGIIFAMCNSPFIAVWTAGKITWPPLNDVLLGIWIFLAAMQMTHCNFVFITKQIGGMRYVYFVEGCVFVCLASVLGYRWGIPGIIVCSNLCILFFSYQLGLKSSSAYFHTKFRELAFGWVRPSLKLAVVLVPLAVVLWLATTQCSALWRLVIHVFALVLIGGPLFLRLGLPPEMVQEAGTRLPRPAAQLLGKLVSRAA